MPKPVISVENLSKAYRIGLKEEIPDTLMGALTGWIKAPLRNYHRLRRLNTFAEEAESREGTEESGEPRAKSQKSTKPAICAPPDPNNGQQQSGERRAESGEPKPAGCVPPDPNNGQSGSQPSALSSQPSGSQPSALSPQPPSDTIWALKDVSFEVQEGEVLGIIGRNGAGKSTLLKILSRITEPTAGRAIIRGRVSSLLEVGTGFHPELTGRENVYMNGTILGMRKKEIDKKFDEIVDFSGVERFLDTPIKRYSSGMKVRLAFAVAAHLEPEILIIDEVLAVGDAEFQKKCLGKMQDVARHGRTVLFVSHNIAAVRSLCSRCILLHEGGLSATDQTEIVVNKYIFTHEADVWERRWLNDQAPGTETVRLCACRIVIDDNSGIINVYTPFQLEFDIENYVDGQVLHLNVHVCDPANVVRFPTFSPPEPYKLGRHRLTCYVPHDLLNNGWHHINLLIVRDGATLLHREDALLSFQVVDVRKNTGYFGRITGAVRPRLRWSRDTYDRGGMTDASFTSS